MPHNTRPKAANPTPVEPEGYELIGFVGQITTLDVDDEELEDRPRFPFGFQAPAPPLVRVRVPHLTSQAWARWLR